ncbi:hypothetical protein GEMRC1_003919 [Eukaryota sp. GEM-RC1]
MSNVTFRQRTFSPGDKDFKFTNLDYLEAPRKSSSSFFSLPTEGSFDEEFESIPETSLLNPVIDPVPLHEELGLSFHLIWSYMIDFLNPSKSVSLQSPDVFGPCLIVFVTALISGMVQKSVSPFGLFYSITLFATLFLSALFTLMSNTPLKPSAALLSFGLSLLPNCFVFVLYPLFPSAYLYIFSLLLIASSIYGAVKSSLSIARCCNLSSDIPLVLVPCILLNITVSFKMII